MATMYSAKEPYSPFTTLSEGITSASTTLQLTDASILPSNPNILTIGYDTDDPEVVLFANAPSGNSLVVERGFQGEEKAWDSGTKVARTFTAYDYNAIISNIKIPVNTSNMNLTSGSSLTASYASKLYPIVHIMKWNSGGGVLTNNILDFDLADESKYIQGDASKTEFIDGKAQITGASASTANVDYTTAGDYTIEDDTKISVTGGEVILKNQGGGSPVYDSNVCSGGTPFALNTLGGYPASAAFDGTKTGGYGWQTSAVNGSTQHIGYTFATPRAICKVVITGGDANRRLSNFAIQGSNNSTDGSDGSWTDLSTGLNVTVASGEDQTFTFTNTTAYSSIRLRTTNNQVGDGYVNVVEIEMMELSSYTADLCTGGTAISEGGTPASAFDGNDTTYWESVGHWIGYDFGAAVTKHIRRFSYKNYYSTFYITALSFQSSSNGTDWTTVQSYTDCVVTPNAVVTYDVAASSPARYWRILETSRTAGGEICLYTVTMKELAEAYPTTGYSVLTKDATQISTTNGISGVTVTQSTPTDTQAKYLVSIDGRTTWKEYSSDAWNTCAIADIHTAGMTKTVIEAITPAQWTSLGGTTLDVAVGLKTTSASVTPSVQNVAVGISGAYIAAQYVITDTPVRIDTSTWEHITGCAVTQASAVLEATDGQVRYVFSVDGQTTWKKFSGSTWSDISSLSATNIDTDGMTKAQVEALTQANWDDLLNTNAAKTLDVGLSLKGRNTIYVSQVTFSYTEFGYWSKFSTAEADDLVFEIQETYTKVTNNTDGAIGIKLTVL